MAESHVSVAPDSTGKAVRTEEVTVGGVLVEQQVVTLARSDGTLLDAGVPVTSLPSLPAGAAVIGHVIVDSAGAVSVTSLPSLPAGTAVIGHVIVDSGAVVVSGTVAVSNLPATQPVSGTVAVSNLPATQPVSGTVDVSDRAARLAGHVTVDSLPAGAVLTTRFDFTSNDGGGNPPPVGSPSYIGTAAPGASDTAAGSTAWNVLQFTYVGGNATAIKVAAGTNWINRTAATYL